MTAAAGFVYHDGIVLCADTLMGGGATSRHASKIMGFRFNDGVALFAVAGGTDLAEGAIQQCEDPLKTYAGKPRRLAELLKTVRLVLGYEYREHVIENKLEDTTSDYAIITALYSEVDGMGLYNSSKTQMIRSRSGCEFIGAAGVHASMAVERFGGHRGLKATNAKRAHLVAAYAIGQAKRHQEDSAGGDSVIIHLESDGMVSSAHGSNEALTEMYADKFHKASDLLMSVFLDLDRGEQFAIELGDFSPHLRKLRQEYRKEVSTTFDLGPFETSETMWEINPPEYLAARRAKKAAQQGQPLNL